MEPDLLTLLLADTGVAGLSGMRASWGERPQGTALPAVVMHLISAVPGYTLDGAMQQGESRVQVDCYALRFKDARLLSSAVASVLSGYRGVVGTTRFCAIFQDNEQDLSEDAPEEGSRIFRMSADYIIYHHATN